MNLSGTGKPFSRMKSISDAVTNGSKSTSPMTQGLTPSATSCFYVYALIGPSTERHIPEELCSVPISTRICEAIGNFQCCLNLPRGSVWQTQAQQRTI